MATTSLPVDEILPRLKAVLAERNAAVLVAPPGAGKTTRVPLALLDAPWLKGRKIIMQEPRRLAARAAARRMAATLDPGPVSQRLGDKSGGAPLVESAGRMFPVETRYLDRETTGRIEDAVASAIRNALATESGSALVFLPGVGEIRRVEERLQSL